MMVRIGLGMTRDISTRRINAQQPLIFRTTSEDQKQCKTLFNPNPHRATQLLLHTRASLVPMHSSIQTPPTCRR